MKDRLVILTAPTALEELLTDCLLAMESECGFTSFPANVHHYKSPGLSVSEQVTGRQKQFCIQIHIDETGAHHLYHLLKQEFSGAGIQVCTLPIVDSVVI